MSRDNEKRISEFAKAFQDANPFAGQDQALASLKQAFNTGLLPIDSLSSQGTTTTVKLDEDVSDFSIFQMIEYAGDLLAIGKITSSEWFKLKNLAKTAQSDNLVLVQSILDAKSDSKE